MISESEFGNLAILNCAEGDTRLKFDPNDPASVERAKQVVTDMLAMGYALFVEEPDGTTSRVTAFDPVRAEYVIMDRAKKQEPKRVAADKVRTTAVAPTAGG